MDEATVDDHPPRDATLADRRRPGRRDYESAELIALLRGQSSGIDTGKAESAPKAESRSVDDLAAARGAMVGVSIGAAMWAAIIFAVWHFM